MKTRKATSIAGFGAAMVGMFAVLAPAPGFANTQTTLTHAGSLTAPKPIVQAAPASAKSFKVGLLASPSQKNAAVSAAPQRVSKYIHR